ncbi:hypothetical protein [Pedobacter sp. MR22-3]|uniref:hypothetical protein n=1 Tax=Pedobacter TaxID=84567 RepID=UPI00224744F7|nr:hypothetical protein [Pedobacter sp. MR22-3]MCX2583773.1 hypothetical protein [Pedobacter sp. MR22-3]
MNANTDIVKFFLEKSIHEPVRFRIELKNNLYRTNIEVEYPTVDNQIEIKIPKNQLSFKLIFSLGYGICYTSYNWNRDISERIRKRDELDFLGRKIFTGSDEEKHELNNKDKARLIDFKKGYFENFSSDFLKKNKQMFDMQDLLGVKTFRTDLNFNNIGGVVNSFNEKFNKNFNVLNIEEDDQLYFATIGFTEGNLIDIFNLGFELCLADEIINKTIRQIII